MQIELMIAEEIISGYLRIRDFLKEARNEYLKKKSKSYALKAKSHTPAKTLRLGTSPSIELNRQKLKLYQQYVTDF
jgi:hypothetical protein